MREFTMNGTKVSDDSKCYVIAEIGHNHQGDVEQCKELFRAAKESGADSVKLQKRDNRSLFTKDMYDSEYNSENAFGPTYGTHREYLEFGKDEYVELQKYAKELDITFFSTAFDYKSADFLSALDMPAYKMASGDLRSVQLLKYVAEIGKPMVISTGGGSMDDVKRAYDTIMPINNQLCIMQCTAGYPPKFEELNLSVISTFREAFPEAVIGFSSHDSGIAMGMAGYVLGARMIEKHFTLNRAMQGTDHAFSLERSGLRRLCRDLERAYIAMGDGVKTQYPSEVKPLFKMAKKIVVTGDLPAGHVLTADDLTIKSPNDGIPPFEMENVIGKTLKAAVKEDDTVSYDNLS